MFRQEFLHANKSDRLPSMKAGVGMCPQPVAHTAQLRLRVPVGFTNERRQQLRGEKHHEINDRRRIPWWHVPWT